MKLQFNDKVYGMDGVSWCMQFVWWCFQQVDKALFMDGGKTASCGELMRWAQAHGQWVATGYRPGDVLIYDFPGTSYKTDHCGICESVSGQYVTAIEGNTSNGNTGSQSNGDGVYRRKQKLSLVLGAYRPKYTDYRAQAPEARGAGRQDDGLPRGVQVRQRPDPQARNDEIICPIRAKFKRLCPAWAQPYP